MVEVLPEAQDVLLLQFVPTELFQRFEMVGATSPSRFSISSRGTPDRIEARSARPRAPERYKVQPPRCGAPKRSSPSPALRYNARLHRSPATWLVAFQQLSFERVETYPLGNKNRHCGDNLAPRRSKPD